MKKPIRSAAIAAPIAAAVADPAVTVPEVPATEPLPSDQISAPQAPVVPAVALDTAPATETAPLPVPTTAPVEDTASTELKAPLEHVDATVPLPSDQLTPLVHAESKPAAAIEDTLTHIVELGSNVALVTAGDDEVALVTADADRDVFDLLRRDLIAAGFGVVILAADTVDLLRSDLDLPPIGVDRSPEPADTSLAGFDRAVTNGALRSFRVEYDVEHDGRAVPPHGRVIVTFAEFQRLQRATAIAPDTDWLDGEEA